jgi:tight adherence protein C
MDFVSWLFALLVAGAAMSLAAYRQEGRSPVRQRLKGKSQSPQVQQVLMRRGGADPILPLALVEKCEEKLGLQKGSPTLIDVQKALAQAGFGGDQATALFMGLKLGLGLAFPILCLPLVFSRLSHPGLAIGALYLLLVVGYYIPSLLLGLLGNARKKRIREDLPDALDLMVVCVEAGQGLNAAIKRVADDLQFSSPTLAQELRKVNLEIGAGREREQALRGLAERTGVEEVTSLCNILIQSDRLGTSMSQTLKVQSETLRTTRRQKLEEMAAKTPVKLVFPLILFIFPTILVVILGPAMIRIMENIMK